VLEIAAGKAARERERLALVEARAGALPFAGEAFDRVLASLFFHHLTGEEKRRALAEAFRVTVPGGESHVADWGPPHGFYARVAFAVVTLLDSRKTTGDNAAGRLPAMIEEAGFRSIGTPERIATVFGTLELLSARKPASERR
jgi:ubiquinone/menaquinone biosynthesis C-methylase UbiE